MKRKLALLLVFSLAVVALASGCVKAASPRGWAQPVQFNDLVLVTTHTGKLDAINPATGDRVWRFPDDWTISDKRAQKLQGIYGAPQIAGDTVFVGDYNGFVYAFKPSDASADKGSRKAAAFIDVKGPVIGGLALDETADTLFVTTGEGKLFALKTAGFRVAFSFDAGDRIWTAPVISGGKVYFATTQGKLFALNAADGEQAWQPFSVGAALVSQPVVSGGTVLVGGFGRTLYAVDASSGKSKWEFEATDWIWSKPFVDSDRVYFADFSGKVFAVSLSSGQPVWDNPFDAGHTVRSGPVLSAGTLVVAADNAEVFGLSPSTGEVSWGPVRVGSTLQANMLAAGGPTVYVAPTGCVGTDPDRKYTYKVSATDGSTLGTPAVCK